MFDIFVAKTWIWIWKMLSYLDKGEKKDANLDRRRNKHERNMNFPSDERHSLWISHLLSVIWHNEIFISRKRHSTEICSTFIVTNLQGRFFLWTICGDLFHEKNFPAGSHVYFHFFVYMFMKFGLISYFMFHDYITCCKILTLHFDILLKTSFWCLVSSSIDGIY